MNILDNPSFQIAQRGVSFNLALSGNYTLDRWLCISDAASRCNIKQVQNPLGVEVEFNANGVGGIWQPIEREQLLSHVGKAKKFAVNVVKKVSGTIPMKLIVLAWGGTANKTTLSPIANFSTFAPAANWSVVATQDYTVTTTDDRYSIDIPSMPNSQNLAVLCLFQGLAGGYVVIRDASLGKTADFDSMGWSENLKRCSWFYQNYPYEILMNTEWGVGRKDPGGFVSFQFPLSYPLRGALGGAGVYDIDVDWPVANDGYWHYGSGTFSEFPGPPTMTCHHRHFALFTIPAGTITSQNTTIWRHWQMQPGAYINFDAELRP